MKRKSLILFCTLLLAFLAISLAFAQRDRPLKPLTDTVRHTTASTGNGLRDVKTP